MKVALFDSGIGGLSVLHQAMRMLPEEQFLYYADEMHVPYGEKTQSEILGFVDDIIKFLIDHEAKIIVIACNTATSVAVEHLRKKYSLPIIGMEPAVKRAIDLYGDRRVLAAATPITVTGDKMKYLIEKVDQQHLVDLIALPRLVRFAEKLNFHSEAVLTYLKEELSHFSLEEYSSFVLGCTHFNYFKESLRDILPDHIHFVDGISGTCEQLIRKLKEQDLMEHNSSSVEYYYSGKRVTDLVELTRIERYLRQLDAMEQIL